MHQKVDITVDVLGDGVIADAVFGKLRENSQRFQSIAKITHLSEQKQQHLIVYAQDNPDLNKIKQVAKQCYEMQIYFFPIWYEIGNVLLGPLVQPDATGCYECAETRRFDCHPQYHNYYNLLQKALESTTTPEISDVLGLLSGEQAVKLILTGLTEPTNEFYNHFCIIESSTGNVSTHRFIRDFSCSVCGEKNDDRRENAMLNIRDSVPVNHGGGWRLLNFSGKFQELSDLYVDKKAGIVTNLGMDITNPLCATGAGRFPMGDYHSEQWSAGISDNFIYSKIVAILETIERYSGLRPRTYNTAIRASTKELGDNGLDLRDLLLYEEEQYALPNFFCRPFDEEQPISWVWGYSFKRKEPICVPEQVVYYDAVQYNNEERFVIETSSGCAIGGCLEEAIFYGLLETIERDAVLRAWIHHTPLPQLDLNTLEDKDIRQSVARFLNTCDYDLLSFDASELFGVPTIWVMALGKTEEMPKTFSASNSHPDPQKAFSGALGELTAALKSNEKQCLERADELDKMIRDPRLIVDQFDHTEIAGRPDAFDRFDFLLNPSVKQKVVSFKDEKWQQWSQLQGDMGKALKFLLDKIMGSGYDVVVVNQTSPEEQPIGTKTVKVLVPGLYPMYFGGSYARLPKQDGLNLHPHPFP